MVMVLFFRWVEDKPVAERLVDLWPNFAKIVRYWESLPKSKRPSSKSYLDSCKVAFFSYVAGIFQPFLTKCQSDKPMIPFLYSDLLKLVKSVLCLVLKLDVVNPCSSLTTMKKIDLTNKSNFHKAKDIKRGFGAKKSVDDLRNSDLATN